MRKHLKFIISFLLGMLFSSFSLVVASTIIQSKEVSYDNSKSHGSFLSI